MATGKTLYKETIGFTEWAPGTGLVNFLTKTVLGKKFYKEHDFEFVFIEYEVNREFVFLIRGTTSAGDMENPLTRNVTVKVSSA